MVSQKNSLIGINTAHPAVRLDVNGESDIRDTLTLFPRNTDPTLVIKGTTFSVDSTGNITFASGQTFPNTPQLFANNSFVGNQLITGTGGSSYGLTVSSPNFLTLDLQAPEFGVGTGIEIETTGTNSVSWQILNTGSFASQGANRLNFRNDSAGIDVMAMTATGDVLLSGNALQNRTSNGVAKAMFLYSPFNGGRFVQCFNSTLSGAAATTPPCGFTVIDKFLGDYVFDLGFQIDDRFVSATVQQAGYTVGACTDISSCNNPLNPNRVEVTVVSPNVSYVDDKINLIVY